MSIFSSKVLAYIMVSDEGSNHYILTMLYCYFIDVLRNDRIIPAISPSAPLSSKHKKVTKNNNTQSTKS